MMQLHPSIYYLTRYTVFGPAAMENTCTNELRHQAFGTTGFVSQFISKYFLIPWLKADIAVVFAINQPT
jgi:hypothetical protein